MRTVLRSCGAALSLLVLGAGTGSAAAQTAVETVAYIALGIDATKVSDQYFERKPTLVNENWFNHQLWRSGNLLESLTVKQEEPCLFRILGKDFNSEKIVERDATIDFRSSSPTEETKQFLKWPDRKGWETTKGYYFAVRGVKVCSRGEVFQNNFERFPATGSCRSELETSTFDTAEQRDRMTAALTHLRTNFCKPRAF